MATLAQNLRKGHALSLTGARVESSKIVAGGTVEVTMEDGKIKTFAFGQIVHLQN